MTLFLDPGEYPGSQKRPFLAKIGLLGLLDPFMNFRWGRWEVGGSSHGEAKRPGVEGGQIVVSGARREVGHGSTISQTTKTRVG